MSMTPDQVFVGIKECRQAGGMDVAVRIQSAVGRFYADVSDHGVARIECYLPSGTVRIIEPPVTQPMVRQTCKDQNMAAVADPKTGAIKCVTKSPPSVVQRLTSGGKP